MVSLVLAFVPFLLAFAAITNIITDHLLTSGLKAQSVEQRMIKSEVRGFFSRQGKRFAACRLSVGFLWVRLAL